MLDEVCSNKKKTHNENRILFKIQFTSLVAGQKRLKTTMSVVEAVDFQLLDDIFVFN